MVMRFRELHIDTLNGYRRTLSGVYAPDREMVGKMLQQRMIGPDEKYPYMPQGREIEFIDRAIRIGQPILLLGPTGVGKTMLAKKIAQEKKLPYLEIVCHGDLTVGQMKGTTDVSFVPVEIGGRIETVQIKTLIPKEEALAGLAGEAGKPVLLLIDEVHEIRKVIRSVLHTLTFGRYVNMADVTGERNMLHPESIVMLAANPDYDVDIPAVLGPPLMARLKTLNLGYIVDKDKLIEIVFANIPNASSIARDVETLSRKVSAMTKFCIGIRTSSGGGSGEFASDRDVARIGASIDSAGPMVKGNIVEAPSPRALVQAVESMLAGESMDDAIVHHLINTTARDLGSTANALLTAYRAV